MTLNRCEYCGLVLDLSSWLAGDQPSAHRADLNSNTQGKPEAAETQSLIHVGPKIL